MIIQHLKNGDKQAKMTIGEVIRERDHLKDELFITNEKRSKLLGLGKAALEKLSGKCLTTPTFIQKTQAIKSP